MSSRTTSQVMLRITKNGTRVAASASSWQESFFGLTPAPAPTLGSRNGQSSIQTRFFRSTPAHRLFEFPDAIVAAGAVAGGALLMRSLLRSLYPGQSFDDDNHLYPLNSWMSSADPKISDDVREIIAAGFEMAYKVPKGRRQQAMKEATFQAPHEVARVIPGAASGFRLEDMGPVPSQSEVDIQQKPALLRGFDFTTEGRVFLYFPDGASTATAAFVAINAELLPPEWTTGQRFATFSKEQVYLFKAAMRGWRIKYITWKEQHPQIVDRIEKGKLPVVFNFRHLAISTLYDTEACDFRDGLGRSVNLTKL